MRGNKRQTVLLFEQKFHYHSIVAIVQIEFGVQFRIFVPPKMSSLHSSFKIKSLNKKRSVNTQSAVQSAKENKKIDNFFKATPKAFTAEPKPTNNVDDTSKQFYVDALKDKLQSKCEFKVSFTDTFRYSVYTFTQGNKKLHSKCLCPLGYDEQSVVAPVHKSGIHEKEVSKRVVPKLVHEAAKAFVDDVIDACDENANENGRSGISKNSEAVENGANGCTDCTEWKEKFKVMHKKYAKLSIEYSELNMKFTALSRTAPRVHGENETTPENADSVFSNSEIRVLQRISLAKKNDSTFIRNSLEFAYKSDLSVLKSRSVMGTYNTLAEMTSGKIEKPPLTPVKVKKIKELFIERLSDCDVDPIAFEERVKDSRINELLASGIKNIAKKLTTSKQF